MIEQVMKVRLTFNEEILGTASSDPKIHETYIASKAPDAVTREEELESLSVEEYVEKSMTVFPRDEEGRPMLWDYQVRGFLKGSCGFLQRIPDSESKALKAYKKVLDGTVFVEPRKIPFVMPEGGTIGSCQRPLRAQTAQGDRVALANSETVPAGSYVEFEIIYWDKKLRKIIFELLAHGRYNGIGQWRNSGKGSFQTKILEEYTREATGVELPG